MSSRSLNRVQLIGNLTRDPELRYTPNGAAVCTIGLATNRAWTTESGERKEETEFHRVVAWNKLAELCSQLLTKGRKVYVEGRLRTTTWQAQDGAQRSTTEIVIDDMILLDPRRPDAAQGEGAGPEEATPAAAVSGPTPSASDVVGAATTVAQPAVKKGKKPDKADEEKPTEPGSENVNPDDIPF
ncbi:single-stranded DNA-binding protein [Candidatus Gottesmanbacteria bacterium]|nr:single-stranded DNA-binding protein [Candidatus Gottesmanbacteria bacterium]